MKTRKEIISFFVSYWISCCCLRLVQCIVLLIFFNCVFHKVQSVADYYIPQIKIPLFVCNHSKYQNMQYTIEKPYKMVTKNDRKILKFSTFVRFLGPFLKKQCFSKIGNFERDENFWMKLSAKLPHEVLWKMNPFF